MIGKGRFRTIDFLRVYILCILLFFGGQTNAASGSPPYLCRELPLSSASDDSAGDRFPMECVVDDADPVPNGEPQSSREIPPAPEQPAFAFLPWPASADFRILQQLHQSILPAFRSAVLPSAGFLVFNEPTYPYPPPTGMALPPLPAAWREGAHRDAERRQPGGQGPTVDLRERP